MYQQFEIVWVRYPFSDQPEKGKTRPTLVVSNEASNAVTTVRTWLILGRISALLPPHYSAIY